MNKNIITIACLLLMVIFGIWASRMYADLKEQKKNVDNEKAKTAETLAKLQVQLDSNLLLKKKYDTITRQLSESLLRSETSPVNKTSDIKLLQDLKSINQSSAILNNRNGYVQASQLEKDGYSALVNDQFDIALARFTEAEKISPSIHMSYEISRYLKKNKDMFASPDVRKEIKKEIIKKYSWGAPQTQLSRMKEQVKP